MLVCFSLWEVIVVHQNRTQVLFLRWIVFLMRPLILLQDKRKCQKDTWNSDNPVSFRAAHPLVAVQHLCSAEKSRRHSLGSLGSERSRPGMPSRLTSLWLTCALPDRWEELTLSAYGSVCTPWQVGVSGCAVSWGMAQEHCLPPCSHSGQVRPCCSALTFHNT